MLLKLLFISKQFLDPLFWSFLSLILGILVIGGRRSNCISSTCGYFFLLSRASRNCTFRLSTIFDLEFGVSIESPRLLFVLGLLVSLKKVLIILTGWFLLTTSTLSLQQLILYFQIFDVEWFLPAEFGPNRINLFLHFCLLLLTLDLVEVEVGNIKAVIIVNLLHNIPDFE